MRRVLTYSKTRLLAGYELMMITNTRIMDKAGKTNQAYPVGETSQARPKFTRSPSFGGIWH